MGSFDISRSYFQGWYWEIFNVTMGTESSGQ
jgi:hypothetical protein